MVPKVIAICGVMRSGKDTIANYICEKYDYKHVKIADTLKKTVSVLFGFTQEQLECESKDSIDKSWGITPRAAMQFLGTEIMQYEIQKLLPNIGRKFWISSVVAKLNSKDVYVISDMRFVHEYEYLVEHFQKENVYVIKVQRPNIVSSQHASEKEFEQIKEDILIVNDSCISSLQKKIDDLLSVKLNNSPAGDHVNVCNSCL